MLHDSIILLELQSYNECERKSVKFKKICKTLKQDSKLYFIK